MKSVSLCFFFCLLWLCSHESHLFFEMFMRCRDSVIVSTGNVKSYLRTYHVGSAGSLKLASLDLFFGCYSFVFR